MNSSVKISPCGARPLLNPCRLDSFEYQIDPYIGCEHFCYYCYILGQAETDWRKEILIYPDISEQLTAEIKGIPPQTIYMGNHTDPYQPCEAVCRQTRKVLEILRDHGFSASILTKSDLVLRDLDIIGEMDNGAVSISVAFADNKSHRLFEEKTRETAKRIEALGKFKDAGVKTGALLCPVIPYITDVFRLVDMLESHADTIWVYGLSMPDRNGPNRTYIENILHRHYPGRAEEIMRILDSRENGYWAELSRRLQALKDERQLDIKIYV